MKPVVLASSNPHKAVEIAAILDGFGFLLRPQSDFGLRTPPEDGADFAENAMIKARHACAHTGLAAIAEDSGLEVAALDNEPGIRSARYAGEDASDAANLELLLERIGALPQDRLDARFRCTAVYLEPEDEQGLIAEGVWEGCLVKQPRGDGGFGYDPIFFVAEYDCTAAQLPAATKNKISHRARAFAHLRALLTERLTERPTEQPTRTEQ